MTAVSFGGGTTSAASKNFSIELKEPFDSFDYRNHLLAHVCTMYVEAIYGMVKKLPDVDSLGNKYYTDDLWKEDSVYLEIFRDMVLPKLEKKINKLLEERINPNLL